MDLLIEKELLKFKTHVIDYASLKSILTNLGYSNVNNKIINLKQKGIIKDLKKGLYVHSSLLSKNLISKEIISNILLDNPSYISLDYALYYYGLIPETVYELTAVTAKRSRIYKTEIGVFSYKHIKKELFSVGLKIESNQIGNFVIAGIEKAVCDKIYLSKDVQLMSISSMSEFLENDLRIELEYLSNLDLSIVSEYYELSKSRKIRILLNLLKGL